MRLYQVGSQLDTVSGWGVEGCKPPTSVMRLCERTLSISCPSPLHAVEGLVTEEVEGSGEPAFASYGAAVFAGAKTGEGLVIGGGCF